MCFFWKNSTKMLNFSFKFVFVLKTRSIQFPSRKWNVYISVWWQFQYTHRYRTKKFVWATWNCCVRNKRVTYVVAWLMCSRKRWNDGLHVVDCSHVIHGVMWLVELKANGMNTADASTHQCFEVMNFLLFYMNSLKAFGSGDDDINVCINTTCTV